MANEVIGIEVQVKLEQLRAQLATLGPGMEKEAKAMTAALNREIKQQTAAMKAASNATSQVRTDSIKEVAEASEAAGTKFDKLAKAAGPLGGVLSRISPEAGALASSLAGLTGAAEGVAAGLGTSMSGGVAAMSAVIGPAVIALALLTANMQYEAAQAEASEAAHKALNEAIKYTQELASGTADAMLDLKVKVGQIAPEEAAFEKALKGVTAEYEKQDAAIEQAIEARKAAGGAWGAEVKALRDSQEESKRLRDERVLLLAADKEWAAEVRKSAEFVAERDRASAKASAAAADAAAAEVADLAEREQALNDWVTASNTAYEQVFAHELAAKESRWALARERVAALQAETDAQKKHDEELAASAAATAQANQETTMRAMQAITLMGNNTADGIMLVSDALSNGNKKAAKQAFYIAKGVAVSAALVNTALAVTNALATVPYPLTNIVAIAAATSGAIQIANIAAEKPSFHRGGMVEEQARGEVSARLLPGEAVLNRQAASALGAGGVDALNAGGGGMAGSVSLRIGRLEAREVIRTDVAAGGLVVQTARAAVATGGNRAGRTGRRPIG